MRAGPCLPLLPISTQQPTHSKDSTSSHSFVQQIQLPRASVSPITGMGGPQPTSHQADHAGSSPVFPPNRRCSSCHALSLLKVSALLSPLDDSHQQVDMSHYLSSLKEKRKKTLLTLRTFRLLSQSSTLLSKPNSSKDLAALHLHCLPISNQVSTHRSPELLSQGHGRVSARLRAHLSAVIASDDNPTLPETLSSLDSHSLIGCSSLASFAGSSWLLLHF